MIVKMIIIKTRIPEEHIKQLSDYFYMDDSYTIITVPEEISDESTIEELIADYGGQMVDDKIELLYPLMILTNSDEVINQFTETFSVHIYREPSVPSFTELIESGFLPISSEPIDEYINCYDLQTLSPTDKIFELFQAMGYVQDVDGLVLPTIKLIESISSDHPDISAAYKIMLNNFDTYHLSTSNISTINSSVFESLKLIDYKLFVIVETEK